MVRITELSPDEIDKAIEMAYRYGRWDIKRYAGRQEVFHKAAEFLDKLKDNFVN